MEYRRRWRRHFFTVDGRRTSLLSQIIRRRPRALDRRDSWALLCHGGVMPVEKSLYRQIWASSRAQTTVLVCGCRARKECQPRGNVLTDGAGYKHVKARTSRMIGCLQAAFTIYLCWLLAYLFRLQTGRLCTLFFFFCHLEVAAESRERAVTLYLSYFPFAQFGQFKLENKKCYCINIIYCSPTIYYVGHHAGMVASTVAPFVTLQVTMIRT